MKTSLQVDEGLLKEFQSAVERRFGKLKGAQSEALSEAIKLWLAFSGKRRYFLVSGPEAWKIVDFEELKEMLRGIKGMDVRPFDTCISPIFDTFDKEDLKEILAAVEEALGAPTESDGSIEELERKEPAVYTWKLKDGRGGYAFRFFLAMRRGGVSYNAFWTKKAMSLEDLAWRPEDELYDICSPVGPVRGDGVGKGV